MTQEREDRGPVSQDPGHSEQFKRSHDTSPGRRIRPPSQREKVAGMLLGTDAVCGTTFLKLLIPRYAAHVHQLRKAGWVIVTRPCSRPSHAHDTHQVEYAVESLPFDPRSGR